MSASTNHIVKQGRQLFYELSITTEGRIRVHTAFCHLDWYQCEEDRQEFSFQLDTLVKRIFATGGEQDCAMKYLVHKLEGRSNGGSLASLHKLKRAFEKIYTGQFKSNEERYGVESLLADSIDRVPPAA